jgi:uncharacterized membrane protein YuzA (DUF378 family)
VTFESIASFAAGPSLRTRSRNWLRVRCGSLKHAERVIRIVVGGLNWGLVGIFKFDLVAWICGGLDFGETNALCRIIYILVGVAAVYQLIALPALLGRAEYGRRVATR